MHVTPTTELVELKKRTRLLMQIFKVRPQLRVGLIEAEQHEREEALQAANIDQWANEGGALQ
ncbi:MAG: hypothetical protein QM817_10600 [Archangium sp.]